MMTLTWWRWAREDPHLPSCLVAKLCLTLCDPMDCSPPGSSVHGILQARILGWVATPFSRGSSWPRDQAHISQLAGGFLTTEPSGKQQNGGTRRRPPSRPPSFFDFFLGLQRWVCAHIVPGCPEADRIWRCGTQSQSPPLHLASSIAPGSSNSLIGHKHPRKKYSKPLLRTVCL